MSDFISPGRIDEVIALVTQHGTGWILAFVFFSMFVENVFPPYPGDTVIFAAGFISGSDSLSLPPLIFVSILGSISSIILVYLVGRRYGRALFEKRKLGFLHPEKLPRIEGWYRKYGNALLLASRFLPGTRFLIVLTAGIGRVPIISMSVLSGISVLIWNSMVILSAYYLHSNWERVYAVFRTYNRVILILIALVLLLYIVARIMRRYKAK
jgi:membrane protein DedA with SNARE-associated domain